MRHALISVVLLSGCASVQLQKDRLASIHRVAFADYQLELSLGETTGVMRNTVHGMVGGLRAAEDERTGQLAARRAEEIDRGSELLRSRLVSALGWEFVEPKDAEALITVKVEYETGRTDGYARLGLGSVKRYPVAIVRFTLISRDGETLWADPRAKGAMSGEPLEVKMGFDVLDNEVQVLTETAGNAFEALLTRYREAKSAR